SCGLLLVGVPYPLMWGAVAGILRFVPYLGSSLVAGALLVFSIAVFPSWSEPLIVMGIFVALELLIYYGVEPLVLRHGTGVSGIALLVAAVFWTWLWGPVGLILSTPMTVCLLVLGKHFPPLQFLNTLLGNEPTLALWQTYYQRLLARDEDEASDLIEEYLQSHPLEKLGDEVLVPVLTQLKRDAKRREVDAQMCHRIVQVTRE